MKHSSTRVASVVLSLLLFAMPALAGTPQRIVAIGDIHGDFSSFVSILTEADLVDADLRWSGGTTILVQTGDYLDRGARVRDVMDLLMRLQEEAAAAGGRVIPLLGNHETMNLLNIFRDVSPEALADFVVEGSEKRQAKAYKNFEKFYTRLAKESGQPIALGKEAKEWWMGLHPLGFLEYADAMAPDGRYGRWLRGRPVAAEVAGNLFIHGGYGPFLEGTSIEEINARIAREIALYDELRAEMLEDGLILEWHAVMEMKRESEREIAAVEEGGEKLAKKKPGRVERARRLEALLGWEDWWLVHPDGPVWFRGAAFWDEEERGAEMNELLDGLGVRRMVVGHTVQQTANITPRFDGRVLLIDTGMLKGAYDGRPSAVEFLGDGVTAIYEGQRRVLNAKP